MKTLTLIVGPSRSGKTTIAQALAAKYAGSDEQVQVIETDDLKQSDHWSSKLQRSVQHVIVVSESYAKISPTIEILKSVSSIFNISTHFTKKGK